MADPQYETVKGGTRRGLALPAIIVVLLLLIALVQGTAPITDHQISNIVTGILGMACLGISTIWWTIYFGDNWLRWVLPCGLLGLAGCGLMIFEFTSFSGELVPQFRYRFASQRDLQTADESIDASLVEETTLVVNDSCFSGFLGPNRDGFIAKRNFSTDWGQRPPTLIWKQSIGNGLAGFATAQLHQGDQVIVPIGITLEQRDQNEALTCYELATGKLLWQHQHKSLHSHPLGDTGPRSTPTISENGLVFAVGATGHVWCADIVSGQIKWEEELFRLAGIDKEQAEAVVTWGRSASPLLVDDFVVFPLGGAGDRDSKTSRTLIALDAEMGTPKWYGGDYQISYASPVLVTLSGRRQIVSVNEDYVSGHDIGTGDVLWDCNWPGVSSGGANCSNPTLVDENKILLSKGYGGGAKLIQVNNKDGNFETEEIWEDFRVLKTKFTNPVVHQGYAYGLSDGTLECVSLKDGRSCWKQPRATRFGHGHILIVEDVILVSSEQGEVAIVGLDSERYQELGRFQAVEGKTWNPIALSGTRLLVRNGFEMACWELGQRADGSGADEEEVDGVTLTSP